MKNELTSFTLGGNLDVSDVLSVVTSRAEANFTTELSKARQVLKEAEEAVKTGRKDVENTMESEAKAANADKVNALRVAVEAMGGKVKVSTRANFHNLELPEELTAEVTVSSDNRGYGGTSFTVKVEPSDALKAKAAGVVEATKAVAVAQEQALHWRKKLSSVPALERQYRAKIAEAKLGQSEEGKDLLALLTTDLDAALLALPVA